MDVAQRARGRPFTGGNARLDGPTEANEGPPGVIFMVVVHVLATQVQVAQSAWPENVAHVARGRDDVPGA